jgi:HTH-type transcriptional regulator, quorum sensing regulator NprR
MSIDVAYIRRQMRVRKQQKRYEPKPLGSAIRYKRQSMNMTLEEGAEGICSISYLSKVENNLIEVSDKFADALIKRFGVDLSGDADLKRYEKDLDTIWDHMITRRTLDKALVSHYAPRIDHQAHLVAMAAHLLEGDMVSTFDRSIDAIRFIPQYSHTEAALLMYMTHRMMHMDERYGDAYVILSLMPEDALEDGRIALLDMMARLENAYRMQLFPEIFRTYERCVNHAVSMRQYDILAYVETMHARHMARFENRDVLKRRLDRMTYLEESDMELIVAFSEYHDQKFGDVIRRALPRYRHDEEWFRLMLYACDANEESERIHGIIADAPKDVIKRRSTIALVHHLRIKHDTDRKRVIPYLKREVLSDAFMTDDTDYLHYMMNDAKRIFARHQHYKDAVQAVNVYQPKINGIQSLYKNLGIM